MIYSRRRFLGASAKVAAVASVWSCDRDRAEATTQSPTFGSRRTLSEPGPMVPPVPAILLTINGASGNLDEISVLWTFVVNGNPPQVGVSAGSEHVVRELLEVHDEFVLNVPTASLIESFDTIDMNSGRIADKFALSGLTRSRAVSVDAPTIEEAPIHCECRTIASLEIPPMRKLFIAEVVATTAVEGAVDQNGRLVVPNVPFFGMTAGSGEHYTMGERVGNIGMTVGRTDIKY